MPGSTFILVLAAVLLGQDPVPGDVVVTAPPAPAPASVLADPFEEEPETDTGRIQWNVSGPLERATVPDDTEVVEPRRYDRLGIRSEVEPPLPPEALLDPVRYAAEQCRPDVRPANEDVEACFDRIEGRIREAQDRRTAERREENSRRRVETEANCRSEQTRDDLRGTESVSAGCSWSRTTRGTTRR